MPRPQVLAVLACFTYVLLTCFTYGASPAAVLEELPRVVRLLDEEVGRLQEQDQHDLDSVAKLKVFFFSSSIEV